MRGLLDRVPRPDRAPRLLFVHAHPDDETLAAGDVVAAEWPLAPEAGAAAPR